MIDEMSLYNKINVLQAEMLDFNKKISPVKNPKQKEALMLTYPEKNKLLSTCISIILAIIKVSVCITGPTIFPTIVYCIEGDSELFWQVTVVSCIITFLLAMMVISVLCISVKRVQAMFREMLNTLNTLLNRVGILKYLYEVITSDFARMNVYKVMYPVVILFVTSVVTFVAYVKNLQPLFYGSLMLISFVLGVLSTIIYNLLNSPELLPFHSPCKVKMEFTTPSPQSKRDLKLSSFKKSEMSPIYQFSNPTMSPESETRYEFIETQSITAFLPDLSPQTYQETIERTHSLQLPFNLNFFRRL